MRYVTGKRVRTTNQKCDSGFERRLPPCHTSDNSTVVSVYLPDAYVHRIPIAPYVRARMQLKRLLDPRARANECDVEIQHHQLDPAVTAGS
jgi:hypothetical protein